MKKILNSEFTLIIFFVLSPFIGALIGFMIVLSYLNYLSNKCGAENIYYEVKLLAFTCSPDLSKDLTEK